mgnify:CR=1 FL=1
MTAKHHPLSPIGAPSVALTVLLTLSILIPMLTTEAAETRPPGKTTHVFEGSILVVCEEGEIYEVAGDGADITREAIVYQAASPQCGICSACLSRDCSQVYVSVSAAGMPNPIVGVDVKSLSVRDDLMIAFPDPPEPSKYFAHIPRVILAPSDNELYVSDAGYPPQHRRSLRVDLKAGVASFVPDFFIIDATRVRVSPNGERMVVVSEGMHTVSVKTGRSIAHTAFSEMPGALIIHGMEADWNAEKTELWWTRHDYRKGYITECVTASMRGDDELGAPVSPSSWPDTLASAIMSRTIEGQPFRRLLTVLNWSGQPRPMMFPILTRSEAETMSRVRIDALDPLLSVLSGMWISPDGKHLVCALAEEVDGAAKHSLAILDDNGSREVARLPMASPVVWVMFLPK